MDAWHSIISREKGLAGMAENVHKGFRAGGRAPRGYRLVKIQTGAVREGEPVTKSKLELDAHAELVASYLKQRALSIGRSTLIRQLKLPWPPTSLVGMEWNALTYAGHTVWNVHNEFNAGSNKGGTKARGGYKGGIKRRPRSDWVVQRTPTLP